MVRRWGDLLRKPPQRVSRRAGLSGKGPLGCYCGSNSPDVCAAQGPAADAECRVEWEVATGCSGITDPAARNSCVSNAFQDLTLPSGYAFFNVACVNDVCATECTH